MLLAKILGAILFLLLSWLFMARPAAMYLHNLSPELFSQTIILSIVILVGIAMAGAFALVVLRDLVRDFYR